MYLKQKYIKTKDNVIVIFCELLQHSDFRHFNPVSAGFVSIYVDAKGQLIIKCHGRSISLGLESDPDVDTELAEIQILNKY